MPALPAEPDPPTAPGAHARRHQARTTDSMPRFCARGSGAPGASGRSGGDGKRRGRAAAGRGLEGARFQCRGGTRRTNAAGVGDGIRAEGDARNLTTTDLAGFTLTSLGVTRSAPSLPCPSLPHTRCRVDARVRCYDPTTSGPEARATCAHLMCEGVPAPWRSPATSKPCVRLSTALGGALLPYRGRAEISEAGTRTESRAEGGVIGSGGSSPNSALRDPRW